MILIYKSILNFILIIKVICVSVIIFSKLVECCYFGEICKNCLNSSNASVTVKQISNLILLNCQIFEVNFYLDLIVRTVVLYCGPWCEFSEELCFVVVLACVRTTLSNNASYPIHKSNRYFNVLILLCIDLCKM